MSQFSPIESMLWQRLDVPGHDACWLEQVGREWSISGVAVFRHADGPACLRYHVRCGEGWETLSGRVEGRLGDRAVSHFVSREGGHWVLDGRPVEGLEALVDLDLSFTPATNLQQLRRVPIPIGRSVSIPVAWFDIDSGTLSELPQTYHRVSKTTLSYEAPSVGYRGVLELADNGFIALYPTLWKAELR